MKSEKKIEDWGWALWEYMSGYLKEDIDMK